MKAFTPDFKLINKSSGADITPKIAPFLVGLWLSESADNQNDTLTISVNGDGVSQFPPSGTPLEVHLGYKETGLVNFGTYKVDTKTLSGMPLILTIKAGQSDFNAPIKTQKSRHFDNKPLGDILATIAKENELELAELSLQISSTLVPYLRQDEESDMNLIRRLAKEHSADGTVKSGKLVFKEKSLPAKIQNISPDDLIDFSLTFVDRPVYESAVATWHDRDTGLSHQVVYTGIEFTDTPAGKVARVGKQGNSKVEAQKQAKAHWEKLHTLQLKARFRMIGNPQITSKLGMRLSGFTDDTDGTVLYVKSVRHEIKNGYFTGVELTNRTTADPAN